ncbi:aromatic ring-hydroxylating oxygenase subunit alpha [Mycobacterium sp.]|uniref:aromatic ring-hydroxylating oxygenase subunit alpha n=1 Tax=Mycobacterium sp. TaxID=1785 RepID=UPI003C75F8AE
MQGNGRRPAEAVLADGSCLEDLISRAERTVSARVFADQEIFELELANIFAKAWIPVALTAELQQPGDFVTRRIGLDPVIVSRDHVGEYHVMLNACSHRGAQVCRGETGNARTHTCPFHGWTFGSDGKLVGVPFERLVYGDRLDKARLGLRQARVGVMSGIIFATWADDAPTLEDYIGDYRFYLDAMLDRTDAGLEVCGPPQRFVVNANWKLLGGYGDNYHVLSMHRSLADIGAGPTGEQVLYGFKSSVNGHAVSGPDFERFDMGLEPAQFLAMMPPAGMCSELVPQLERRLSLEQVTYLGTTPPSTAAIFPSTSILMFGAERAGQQGERPAGQSVNLRFFAPLGPDRTELFLFYLVERDAPEELKARMRQNCTAAFGIGGYIDEDDFEVFNSIQRSLEGVIARQEFACYRAAGTPLDPDPARPGIAFRGVSTDDGQWAFYERYFEFLEGKPW